MGCPGGHEHDPKKIVMAKKGRCRVFGRNDDRLFPRNIQWSSLFARKARVNTEGVPPGHPIILLKCNKFNMAAVMVKRLLPHNGKNIDKLSSKIH